MAGSVRSGAGQEQGQCVDSARERQRGGCGVRRTVVVEDDARLGEGIDRGGLNLVVVAIKAQAVVAEADSSDGRQRQRLWA